MPPQGGGYGYPPPGGPGGFPPPPNNKKRNVWIAVGAVVVIGAIIGGVVAASGGGDDKPAAKKVTESPLTKIPTDLPSDLPTDFPSDLPSEDPTGLPTDDLPTDTPSLDLPTDFPSFTLDPTTPGEKIVPYVVLKPGQCFDAPTLTHTVDEVTKRTCTSPHDGQVVANETLTGTFSSDMDIQTKALDLCTSDAEKHLPHDGRSYYPYALFPKLSTYEFQKRNTVTCSLTLNNGTNGKKLYSKLG
jgi:hypothetical protein